MEWRGAKRGRSGGITIIEKNLLAVEVESGWWLYIHCGFVLGGFIVKQVVIDRDGMRYKWVVLGLDEDACAADIEVKQMTEMSDYIGTVFGEKYGCAVTLEPVRLMSRNQYQAYLQGNAQRMVDDVGYTIDDYRRDAKRVEVLPFQLDGFRLSSGQKAVMDNRFTSISYTQEGDACLRGRVGSTVGVGLIAKELGCELVCKQDFSGFYKSDLHKFILEFADGDVSLLICKSHMSYANRLAELHQNFEISGYDVCLEIYFDNVHMDNMFVPREHVPMAISSLMQRGFEG